MCDDCHDYDSSSYENITFEPVSVSEFADVEYGLLTPRGQLFACDYYGHANLTSGLIERGYLKDTWLDYGGSIHISDGELDFLGSGTTVTQAQMDAMFDYAIAHELTIDFSKLEVVDESVQTRSSRSRTLSVVR